MKLDGETDVLQTYSGSLCTLLILAVSVLYTVQKSFVLIERKDVDVLSTTLDSFFDENYVFNYQNGFNVAVAFSGFTNEAEYELDPSYGKLTFNAFQWGIYPNGTIYSVRNLLEHHLCTKAELGQEEDRGNSKFF